MGPVFQRYPEIQFPFLPHSFLCENFVQFQDYMKKMMPVHVCFFFVFLFFYYYLTLEKGQSEGQGHAPVWQCELLVLLTEVY